MKYALTNDQKQFRAKVAALTNPQATWSDEMFTKLKELWIDGISASKCAAQINYEFGTKLTRNAVISKVHRGGLPGRRSPNGGQTNRHLMRAPTAFGFKPAKKPKIKANAPKLEIVKPPHPSTVEPLSPLIQPNGRPRAIAEGPGRLCAWIDADPKDTDAAFCGRPRLAETSFCEHHYHRAYQPLTPKQMAQRAEGAALPVKRIA